MELFLSKAFLKVAIRICTCGLANDLHISKKVRKTPTKQFILI